MTLLYKIVAKTQKVSAAKVWRHVKGIDPDLIDLDKPEQTKQYIAIMQPTFYLYHDQFPLKDIVSAFSLSDQKLEYARAEDWSDPAMVPALVLRKLKSGTVEILDGAHRLAIAKEKGMRWLPAYVGEAS